MSSLETHVTFQLALQNSCTIHHVATYCNRVANHSQHVARYIGAVIIIIIVIVIIIIVIVIIIIIIVIVIVIIVIVIVIIIIIIVIVIVIIIIIIIIVISYIKMLLRLTRF